MKPIDSARDFTYSGEKILWARTRSLVGMFEYAVLTSLNSLNSFKFFLGLSLTFRSRLSHFTRKSCALSPSMVAKSLFSVPLSLSQESSPVP